MKGFAKKIFGSSNERYLRSLKPLVEKVGSFEPALKKLSDEQLRAKTAEFRQRLEKGESLDALEAEAFAVCREAAFRTLGMRHFDVQLIGGHVLHQGKIAEMKTGEGKTLVATLAAYLNALPGKGVHIVTVNDYLAKRDAEWMGNVYRFLGLDVGVVYGRMPEEEKKAAYEADITYGQNNEFGFDFLRDNMKFRPEDQNQRGHFFAVVDEVDSILIDEARTPLIISGPAEDATELYAAVNKIIPKFKEEKHYEIDLKSKNPALNEEGIAQAEELLGVDNLYAPENISALHHINQALRAHKTMQRDTDYVVQNGEVIIVDDFTGRLMPGRRWSDGLHQAVEAKEGVAIARENRTLASITFQNYFRMYDKLSGMTGTADTEAVEFFEIYKLEVVVIPTNKPLLRDDQSDVVYRTRKEKYEAVCDDIAEVHESKQPILVGTVSIEQSETLSKILSRKGIEHEVLNAKNHEREADIVAQAGRLGGVTIATNMAGRGTDIVLGGNPEGLATQEIGEKDIENPDFQAALERYRAECEEEKKQVLAAGGLFVVGTERHESRRIDNQLRGRSGRQGDPGTTRFYISLEDDLMQRFGGERMQMMMQRLGWEEGVALDGRIISRTIENAQKKVEAYHFEGRKNVTEYDDVMNKQRQVIYALRSQILRGEKIREQVLEMINDLFEDAVLQVCDAKLKPMEWDIEKLAKLYQSVTGEEFKFPEDMIISEQGIFDMLREKARELYLKQAEVHDKKLEDYNDLEVEIPLVRSREGQLDFLAVEQDAILEALDFFWNHHLTLMDELRDGINFRGYGQINPKYEYQKEGFEIFQQTLGNMRQTILQELFHYQVPEAEVLLAHYQEEMRRREAIERQMEMTHESAATSGSAEEDAKSPEEQQKKLASQRKARRRKKKK